MPQTRESLLPTLWSLLDMTCQAVRVHCVMQLWQQRKSATGEAGQACGMHYAMLRQYIDHPGSY